MRRKKAIYFFGGMAFSVVGYFAWAARIHYVRPSVEFDRDVTPDAVKHVEKWMSEHTDFFSFPFDWNRFADDLCDPYKTSLTPVTVTHHYYGNYSSPSELVIYRKGQRNVVRFWWDNGAWQGPTIH